MPITVSKTIHVDSRNTIIRHRDGLQTHHGVQLFFPKNAVRGLYQDMVIKGSPTACTKAERDIERILLTWNEEYQAFKERKARRKAMMNHTTTTNSHFEFPSVPTSSNSKPRDATLASNPFSLLLQDEPTTPPPHEPTPQTTPQTTPKQPVLKGWAAIAAKPAAPAPVPAPAAPKTTTASKPFSWADVAFDDDSWSQDEDDEDDEEY